MDKLKSPLAKLLAALLSRSGSIPSAFVSVRVMNKETAATINAAMIIVIKEVVVAAALMANTFSATLCAFVKLYSLCFCSALMTCWIVALFSSNLLRA